MKKYVVVDGLFLGKINWENDKTISVNESRWCKRRTHYQKLNLIEYGLLRLAEWVKDKIIVDRIG